jgi:hypothetical protein
MPDGTKGFDCNQRVPRDVAQLFYDAGYRFAVRYVRRSAKHSYDLTVEEVNDLLDAKLGLMVVQHVGENWHPTLELGRSYGTIAAAETKLLDIPNGIMVWCDLEDVMTATPSAHVIEYCNSWYDAVAHAGYTPGLYVGYNSILSSWELYYRLKFMHYWGAYNVNSDQEPLIRGFQMRQKAATLPDLVRGTRFEFDVNVIKADRRGGTPVLLVR